MEAVINSSGAATMYGLIGQGIVVLFPAIARYINLVRIIQTGSGAHQILSNGYRRVIPPE
jgi:hypothetical protein